MTEQVDMFDGSRPERPQEGRSAPGGGVGPGRYFRGSWEDVEKERVANLAHYGVRLSNREMYLAALAKFRRPANPSWRNVRFGGDPAAAEALHDRSEGMAWR
jgi:hypothetical protein